MPATKVRRWVAVCLAHDGRGSLSWATPSILSLSRVITVAGLQAIGKGLSWSQRGSSEVSLNVLPVSAASSHPGRSTPRRGVGPEGPVQWETAGRNHWNPDVWSER